MKKKIIIVMAALNLVSLPGAQAQFTAGNLVVLRVGNGSGALTSAGTPIFLDQYTTIGGLVNSLAIPSSGTSTLVNSGSATSEGGLTLSANNQYLVFAGYNAPAGTPSIASTTSAANPRGVATVDAFGNYTLAATSSSFFSANNIRSAGADGNGNFWAAGANSGAVYMGTGTPGAVSTTSANNRVIQDIGGNLYFSTGSGSTRGIYKITGEPTSGANTAVSLINNGASASPYGFAFNPGITIAYVADSTAYTSSSGIGGIEKWAFNGSAWIFQYSLSLGTDGAQGLAVDFSQANPIIYATSSSGLHFFDVVDTGPSATGTLLATASANEAFRGLAFSPVAIPEPSVIVFAGLSLLGLIVLRPRSRKS